MTTRRSTAPKKESANPPPPVPETDLRAFEYDRMDRVIFQWMNAGRNAFIKIDGQHVVDAEDMA